MSSSIVFPSYSSAGRRVMPGMRAGLSRRARMSAIAATVAAIADVLARRLKPARVPGIARLPAVEYGGKTMLELIAADRHDWLLDSVRRSFDYAATA